MFNGKKQHSQSISVVFAVLFLLVNALFGLTTSSAATSVTIGYQGPLSGPESPVGIDQINGVKYAVDTFNEQFAGKIKVNLKQIDDQGDPSIAVKVAETAAKDSNLIGIIGPAYSGAAIASFPFYKSAAIPLISPSASRPTLTDPSQSSFGGPIFHRLAITDVSQGPALYKVAVAGVSNPKVFVVDDNSSYVTSLLQYMKSSGASLVGQDSVNSSTTDWTPTVAKIKNSLANVVIYLGYFNDAARFFKQIRDSGYSGVLAGPDGIFSAELVNQSSAKVIDGVRITSSVLPVGYVSPTLDMDYKKRYGISPGTYSLESLDAANIMLYCIASGTTTRKEMLNCINEYSGLSLSGRDIFFDPNGDIRFPQWYEFWAKKDAIGTFPFELMSNTKRYTTLESTIQAFPWYKYVQSGSEVIPGLILYTTYLSGTAYLYTMNSDGSNQKYLAPGQDGRWSPDGKRIVFSKGLEIYVMDADGTDLKRLTNNNLNDMYPAWSPNGDRIAFVRSNATDPNNLDIYTMDLSGSNLIKLTDSPGVDHEPSWSPDGQNIVFWSDPGFNSGKGWNIYVMKSDGTNKTNISNSTYQDHDPAWSPDGKQIAFVSNSHGGYPQLYLMNIDGTNRKQLTVNGGITAPGLANVQNPAWSPDGKRILFVSISDSNSPSAFEIYSINRDGTDSKNLTKNLFQDSQPDWQPLTQGSSTPSASPTPTSSSCSGSNGISAASLTRLNDNSIQVEAKLSACSYEIVVVSDSGENFRTGVINTATNSLITIKEDFLGTSCKTGYSFYINAWTERNSGGTLNKSPTNRMLAATCPTTLTTTASTKPTTPTFSGVNFVGNKINVSVNIGSSANRPEKVYLVAPKLGFTSSNPSLGTINGSTASWTLDLNSLLGGTAIPLEIVGEKDGVKSEQLTGTYNVPNGLRATLVPTAPSKFTSRIVGTSALITVQISKNEKNSPSEVFLFSKSLGIAKSEAISGEIVGNKGIIEIPIKASMSGKKYPVIIYLTNNVGESKPLNANLAIPGIPNRPLPTAVPKQAPPETVVCVRANQTRIFTGSACPAGWTKK